MKKYIAMLVLLVACIASCFIFINRDENVYAKSISVSKNEVTCELNDEFYINKFVKISTDNNEYNMGFYYTSNNDLDINYYTGLVKATKVGEFLITINAKINGKEFLATTVTLNVIQTIYATSIDIEDTEIYTFLNHKVFNKIIYDNSDVNCTPIIEYSTSNIVRYNYENGQITTLNEGSCIVTIKTKSSRYSEYDLQTSFYVNVTSKNEQTIYKTIDVGKTTTIRFKSSEQTSPTVIPDNSIGLEILEYDFNYLIVNAVLTGEYKIKIVFSNTVFYIIVKVVWFYKTFVYFYAMWYNQWSMGKKLSTYKIIFLGFIALIILGGLLLWLPISTTDGHHFGFVDSLFTSASSVCVTGLSTIPNLGESLSVFGKIVVGLLMEIGGLGIITLATFFIILAGNKIGFHERFVLKESWNLENPHGVVKLIKNIVIFTICFQLFGAILNFFALSSYPFGQRIGISLFHAISSFNNVGLDIFGTDTNMIFLSDNILLNISTMILIVFGGLGFVTIFDVYKNKKWHKFSTTSKIILVTVPILILGGATLFYLFEDGKLNFFEALFQSISARTAGFSINATAELSNSSIMLLVLLMFIGGAPGSIAGGIKITTFVLTIKSIFRVPFNKDVNLYKRHIPNDNIFKAFCLIILAMLVIALGIILLTIFDPSFSIKQILVEVVSAYATVGLSLGITSSLSVGSKLVLIVTMFIGKLGPLMVLNTISSGNIEKPNNIKYLEENIMIG